MIPGYTNGILTDNTHAYVSGGSVVERNGNQYITSYGLLAKTADGGKTWQDLQKGSWLDQTQNLKDITALSFLDNTEGYLADDDNQLLHTTDGGVTWTMAGQLPGRATQLLFTDRQNGFLLAGDEFFSTKDGGAHFIKEYTAPNALYQMTLHPATRSVLVVGRNGLLLKRN